MTKLIITRGLPGSGKTTWARAWVAEDPVRRARVNRDDLRLMVHDLIWLGHDTERQIIAVRDGTILSLLRKGIDVVCDDTNLPQRVARDLRRIAVIAGAEFAVHDLTHVPVKTCIERDAARDRVVGWSVIHDMHMRYIVGKTHPLLMPEETAHVDINAALVPYEPPADAPSAVMVDIDGTVALMVARDPFDESRVHEDRPNIPVIAAVRAMHDAGHRVIFCSGRTEGCREATAKWIAEHVSVPYDKLFMRAVGDMRKDSIVKVELFDANIRRAYRVVCVFDDRNQVVETWRALGLIVFQVADGNF